MESIVIDIKTENDKILLSALANRLHLKSVILSDEEKEDMGLLVMMGERSKELSLPVKSVYSILKKIK